MIYENGGERIFVFPDGSIDFLDRADLVQKGYFGVFQEDSSFYDKLKECNRNDIIY